MSYFSVAPRHSIAPRLLFLFLSPLRIDFSPCLVLSSLFDTFWHRLHSNFGQKRAQKRDRWRDESRRSRRQMEGEQEDGRRRKEQSLVFLLQGHPTLCYYTTDSFYITKTVNPLTLNLSCISGPSSNTLLLQPGTLSLDWCLDMLTVGLGLLSHNSSIMVNMSALLPSTLYLILLQQSA